MPELVGWLCKTDRDFEILTVVAPGLQGRSLREFPKWFQNKVIKMYQFYLTAREIFQAYQIHPASQLKSSLTVKEDGKIQFGAISNADAKQL